MNSDGRRCDNCNNAIYAGQRYCDKCGYRLNRSIVEGKLLKRKIKRRSRYGACNSISKFLGCCGANNEPISSGKKIESGNFRVLKLHSLSNILT